MIITAASKLLLLLLLFSAAVFILQTFSTQHHQRIIVMGQALSKTTSSSSSAFIGTRATKARCSSSTPMTQRCSSRSASSKPWRSSSSSFLTTRSSTVSSSDNQQQQQQQQQKEVTAAADTAPDNNVVEDQLFLEKCRLLCNVRNYKFDKVKNARDLHSVQNSTVIPNILYRMGRVSDATLSDITTLFDELHIKTLIDLRSPTEWKDDLTIMRNEVYGNFTNYLWIERKANLPNPNDCLKVLPPGSGPVKPRKQNNGNNQHASTDEVEKVDADVLEAAVQQNMAVIVSDDDNDDEPKAALVFQPEEELCTIDCDEPTDGKAVTATKTRYFVSLMNEFKYVQGTVSKVRKRDITKSILKSPGAIFSKRVRSSLKKPFMDKINAGGLPMLNELLLRFGAPGIKYVLELCADETNYPISFYCTAGKDRTGMIAAIILSLCNVPDESIVEDYTLSANVYAEMNDHQAMVGALSQRNIDPKIFLGAPAHVMRDTLSAIRENYGSVEGYCTWIGFTKEKQEQLRNACMIKKE